MPARPTTRQRLPRSRMSIFQVLALFEIAGVPISHMEWRKIPHSPENRRRFSASMSMHRLVIGRTSAILNRMLLDLDAMAASLCP
ncbi:MAG: hypothetical protein KDK89_22450 [Alphaproteobacteria bacterium]|nr:hypothetical protein [Alphaproteobacteria bacterium]